MSVARTSHCQIRYRWCFPMIPWYRQVLSLVYGVGVMLIAVWALEQGQGAAVILGVVGMSLITLLLIFGIEVDSIRILDRIEIEFTDTSKNVKDDRQGGDKE